MNAAALMALAVDPALILTAQGLNADPWQRQLLFSSQRQILINCSRGAGKSRTVSALALHAALFRPPALILLLSRSQRQSGELFRYVKQGYRALGKPIRSVKETTTQLELANGSRIVCLPGKEETIRSFQGVHLLVLDEAARIPDALFASVSPMTGVSKGRTVCLSTPFGQRGWWWKEWHSSETPWQRFRVPWSSCPRLSREFIDEERRKFGESWVAQEYECSFTALEGLVYPGFFDSTGPSEMASAPGSGKRVGGIDFGFRNPLAVVWGEVHDDVLFIDNEIYVRETPMSALVGKLPRDVLWSADPSGAAQIAELRLAGFKVLRALNDIQAGIAAVTARLQTKRLLVNRERCPNLLAEARLYRYPAVSEGGSRGENPVDDNNHAMDALRYLVSRLDARLLARYRRSSGCDSPAGQLALDQPVPTARFALPAARVPYANDPAIWTTL